MLQLRKNHVESRLTWEDALEKLDTEVQIEPKGKFLIGAISTSKRIPTYGFAHREQSVFPGGFTDVLNELKEKEGIAIMDVYISFTKKSDVFEAHSDDVDVLIVQMIGKVSYLIEGETYTVEPGDSLFIPKGVVHQPILHGPRVTLSCSRS